MMRVTRTAAALVLAVTLGPAGAAAQSTDRAHDLLVKPVLTTNSGKTVLAPGSNVPVDQLVKLTCHYAFVILEHEKTPALVNGGGALTYAPNTGKWAYNVLPWRGAVLLDGQTIELFGGETHFEAKPYPDYKTAYGTPRAGTGSASKEVVLAMAGTHTFRCLVDADKKFVEPTRANNSAELVVRVVGRVTVGTAAQAPTTVKVIPPAKRRRP
jgi:hypothetical protein